MHLLVTEYVNALADAGRAPASIERALAAIAAVHRTASGAATTPRAGLAVHHRGRTDPHRAGIDLSALVDADDADNGPAAAHRLSQQTDG